MRTNTSLGSVVVVAARLAFKRQGSTVRLPSMLLFCDTILRHHSGLLEGPFLWTQVCSGLTAKGPGLSVRRGLVNSSPVFCAVCREGF